MSSDKEPLQAGIAALEAQRGVLGDAVVDAMLSAARAQLAALSAESLTHRQTLKQVTILFLDVVGSTSLSRTLDPEDIHAVMDGALARASRIVETHHGRILQYAGDNLLAAFGADQAHEDDAEHAVRCGLELLDLGRTLGSEIQTGYGHSGFDVRVGAHTGGVLLGGGVDAEGTIRGMAVNIAARMEQTAPAGALRISADTYAQVRGLFDVEEQAPIQVKGSEEPIHSYLVTRMKPRSFRIGTRGIEGIATRMIGRDGEWEALQEVFKRLLTERAMSNVLIVGDAGLGKSRLLYEFESWVETRPEMILMFRGRANPHTQGQPFGLLRDIFAWRFQIADDDTVEAARSKLEAGIMPLFQDDEPFVAEGHAHLVGHLIGIEYRESRHIKGILNDPRQIRNRALHASAQMFRRVSASSGHPVVLQLDDLHWADDESLDFLDYLAEVNRDAPMLILATTRPTLFERRRDWESIRGTSHVIDLTPLDKTGSRMLANELLKKLSDVPAALRELITGGSEGNPFYMEELVKMLIAQGAIEAGSEPWVVNPAKLLAADVPATLTAVLQARLDSLPSVERHTLQVASVIGVAFWDQALVALDQQATETLPALVKRDLIVPRGDAAPDGIREYAFKHQILHHVTYNTVLKRARKELHGKLAHWLSILTGLRANDFLGITAEHYEEAGDSTNAAIYHVRAAEHASTRMAHERVQEHVKRGLGLIESSELGLAEKQLGTLDRKRISRSDLELRWRLLRVHLGAVEVQAKRSEQRADLEAMDRLADELDDDQRRGEVAMRRAQLAMRTADWKAEEAAARRGALLAERACDSETRLKCLRYIGDAITEAGDWKEGQRIFEDGLAQARKLGLRRVESTFLNSLAHIASNILADHVSALELNKQCLAIEQEIGNKAGEAVALGNIGTALLWLGDLAHGGGFLEQALQLARSTGDRVAEATSLHTLSILARWQGEDMTGLALARLAKDIAVAVEGRDQEATTLIRLGQAELALGRFAEAKQAFESSLDVALKIGHPRQYDAITGLAQVAMTQNDPPGGLLQVERLIAHKDAGGSFDGVESPRLLELTCYQVLDQAGDRRAGEWLERAHHELQSAASGISDPKIRQDFLSNIPEHRAILEAWAARQMRSN